MATYNGAKYIKEQINSILPQLNIEDELIISDDGSNDGTLEIIKDFKDPRIKLLEHTSCTSDVPTINKITQNFENAISKCMGESIFLSDQDDIWFPDKIKRVKNELKKVDMTICDGLVMDYTGKVISETILGDSYKLSKWQTLYKRTPYPGCCMAFNRVILDDALPFPKNIQSHDRWLGYIGRFFYSFSFIKDPLIINRRHQTNSSTMMSKSHNPIIYRIKERLRYIKELGRRFLIRQKIKILST